MPVRIMGQFGDKFRKAREEKNLTLDKVSKVTKAQQASCKILHLATPHFSH